MSDTSKIRGDPLSNRTIVGAHDPNDQELLTMNTIALSGVSPYLRCLKGSYVGYDIPILSTGILIGRDPVACHLVFDKDADVSRYHCRVCYNKQSGFFIITDLNSTNGVFSEDGQRLAPGSKLALIEGQCFMLCGSKILFQVVLKLEA